MKNLEMILLKNYLLGTVFDNSFFFEFITNKWLLYYVLQVLLEVGMLAGGTSRID